MRYLKFKKKNTPEDLLNKVIPVKVWVYEAKTLELVKGSPFFSKRKASRGLGISPPEGDRLFFR